METSLGINQAVTPLDRTTPLTSIENRTEIIEKDPLLPNETKQSKGCHRTKVGDGRYSVSSSSSLLKNNFYAIHHSFNLDENNDPHQQQEQEKLAAVILSSPSSSSSLASPPSASLLTTNETPLPSTPQQVTTSPSTLSIDVANQISRKRQTPDPATETSEIIGVFSPPPAIATIESNDSKRKKVRQIVKHRKPDLHSSANNNTSQEYCLFKSCSSIWPGSSHSLGELSHQNITELSNLLKIRLCQAKFNMMATLDQENDLFDFLNDEYVPPQPKIFHTIQLPNTHNQSTMSVVGNGKNLFHRYIKRNQNNNNSSSNSTNKKSATAATSTIKDNGNNENASSAATGGKKHKQNSQSEKAKRISKRKSVPSVVLSDGTKVYVCEPCGKKYKNRNGLTYHLERCKNKVKKEEPTKLLNCICAQPSNDHNSTSLIQCEKCRSLLHTECMGLTSDLSTHNDFVCPHCKDDSEQQQQEQQQQQQQEDVNTQKTVSTIVSKTSPLMEDLHIVDDEESIRAEDYDTQNDKIVDLSVSNGNNKEGISISSNNNNDSSNALHVWEDFSFSSALDKMFEPWSMLSEEEPFSSQLDPSDIPPQWNVNGVLNQPPSLLFSDATLSSTLEDDSVMVSSELTPLPISENTPPTTSTLMPDPSTIININNTVNTSAQHSTDGLWFQFANFDDDYQCEQ